jgi:tetratricopeptide (TPR) repeat protein
MKLNRKTYFVLMMLLFFIVSQIFILNSIAQQLRISSNAQPQAVEYLQRAVNKMEEALATYQGANYPGRKLWAEAIDYAQISIDIEPNFIEAHYYLAMMYQHTGWFYREAVQWERYLELVQQMDMASASPEAKQNLAHAYYRLGSNYYQKGDINKSFNYFLKSTEEYPDSIESNYWLARVYYETGDYNQAAHYYQQVLNLQPGNEEARYWLRQSQLRLGGN